MVQKRVLIVEDEANMRTVLREVLERSGYLAAEAADGSVGSLAGLGFSPAVPWGCEPPLPVIKGESPSRLRVDEARPLDDENDPEAALRLILLTAIAMAAAYLLYQLTAR